MRKCFKFIVCMILIFSFIVPLYAANTAADGSAFVTKEEFDKALADFTARLNVFEAGINSKIDSQVTSYLDRNGIWNGKTQTVYNQWPATRVKLYFINGHNTDPMQRNLTFDNYYWWGEHFDPSTVAGSKTGWNFRWDKVSLTSNNKGCIDRDSITPLSANAESGLWVQKDVLGPWLEHEIRNGYTDCLYFIPDKSGLAHIQFVTNPIWNNSLFDVEFWASKSDVLYENAGNSNQVAITKEWHLCGFKNYEINPTTKKIVKPLVDTMPDTNFTISSHNIDVELDRAKPMFDKAYKYEGVSSNTILNMHGNKVAFTLLQVAAYDQQVSSFCFVNKNWLYTIEIYTGRYDATDTTRFANNEKPNISYKNTNPTILIY